jgi:ribosome modulation factor
MILMARLNITLPDELYARLEQHRDRINLSKVCATALGKEITMLEGQPPITDPRIAQLLQRLQSTRERWHQRGYEDGIGWAVDLASRDELQNVATYMADLDGQQLMSLFKMPDQPGIALPAPPPFPPMQQGPTTSGSVGYRVIHKHATPLPSDPRMVIYHHAGGKPFPAFPESFHPDERLQYWQNQDRTTSGQAAEGEGARVEIDKSAYLEGWRDAVKGIWQTIAPALS